MGTVPVALQLYTVREDVEVQGMRAVLERVAAMGYVGVEAAGFGALSGQEFAGVCRALGLELASAHVNLERDDDAMARVLDEYAALGFTTVVVPFLPPDVFTDAERTARLAAKVGRAAELADARGLTLGYHNHFWEFADMGGRPALLEFFDCAGPGVVAELDVYWAQVGGADVVALLGELGSRVQLLHVKDGPADDHEASMTAVGAGVLDIPAILAAAPGVAWHCVELDRCATDMLTAVAESQQYLVGNGLSRGRS